QALSEEQKKNIATAVDIHDKVDAAAGDLREVLEGIEAKKKAEAAAAEEENASEEETAEADEVSETEETSEAETEAEENKGDEE
ncbi:MAG: hypothetical protein IKM72_09590, partial [Oscillospiraceae bacterium]|nr:hypothetical protein [Oscillospiraceae bacterium]